MTKKVYVLSKAKFETFYKSLTDKQISEICFISINDDEKFNRPSTDNYLNLYFHDVDEDTTWASAIKFDRNHAEMVKSHVEVNKDKTTFVVHCTIGISRSGAVGMFIADFLEIPYFDFLQTNRQVIPNSFVTKILRNEKNI